MLGGNNDKYHQPSSQLPFNCGVVFIILFSFAALQNEFSLLRNESFLPKEHSIMRNKRTLRSYLLVINKILKSAELFRNTSNCWLHIVTANGKQYDVKYTNASSAGKKIES
ncbi:CLUMA_CG016668, isoform A [Clunio marinus]|uniref:CLUMA_CG016668, isoform A n=1 Tax=Clunio marinus TaxID=568069 RepID=A0A1J1ITK5_9DIPT|nr:CLUMA_CG016668, isoform A [Clunio marinus]